MARKGDVFLDSNDQFPELHLRSIAGGELVLPREMGPDYGVLLLYRGHW
jgi:hypothetical protein